MDRIIKTLSGIIFFLTSGLTYAQENSTSDSVKNLKEVVVIYKADKATPVTFQNIGSVEIKSKSTGQEPSFILSGFPSITAYSDAGNTQGYSYFRMRGIDQTRINITLDGVPLNEPEDQGAYFSNYPDIFNSVSSIQIQRGVGTSKNGVASYAGSIQLFSPNLGDETRFTAGIDYGSFNSFRTYAEYNSGIINKKAVYIRGSVLSSDGYKYQSANQSQSVFLSSAYFRDKSSWKINILAGRQANQLAWLGVKDSLIAIDPRTNANENEKDNFTQCMVQLQHRWRLKPASSVQSALYYTYLKGYYDFNLNSFLGLPTNEEMYRYAFASDLIGFFSNYSFSRSGFNLTAGVHGNAYKRQHTGSYNLNGQLYQNTGYRNEASTFIKADYTWRRITIFTDLQMRYSNFDYHGSVPMDHKSWVFLNPKAGISTDLGGGTVYYSLGRAGREPTRNDMFGGNDDLVADEAGKPLLTINNPEYVNDHELGYRFENSRVKWSINAYYLDFKNEIILNGNYGPNGLALTNDVDNSYRTGLEFSITAKAGNHFVFANHSCYGYAAIREQHVTFHPILNPELIINQEVSYYAGPFSLSLMARYQSRSYLDFANTSFLKAYMLVNSRLGYRYKRLEGSVFLNNLTDVRYYNNGYIDYDGSRKLFVQAPFNYSLALKYSF